MQPIRSTHPILLAVCLCALSALAVICLFRAFPVHIPLTFGPVGMTGLCILVACALGAIAHRFPIDPNT